MLQLEDVFAIGSEVGAIHHTQGSTNRRNRCRRPELHRRESSFRRMARSRLAEYLIPLILATIPTTSSAEVTFEVGAKLDWFRLE
jgi:hypothetical protein